MTKLFLDCGSNLGQGFEHFLTEYGSDDFEYFLFEPNEHCAEKLIEKYSDLNYVKIFRCAVGCEETFVDFYFRDDFDVGGSIVTDHNNYHEHLPNNVERVKVIDLVELIKRESKNYEEIYVKLDVESAEYDILEKLIETSVMSKIKKIYVEFHSQYMKDPNNGLYYNRQVKITQSIKNFETELVIWH
jgi:FkbM family methyltransferase